MPLLSSEILRDVFSSRPAAGSAGRIFFASDTGKVYRDNGTSWDDCTSTATVSSVALTVPSWYSVSGSPVTSSGTLAVSAATGQTANRVLATPNGSTGAVSLRALVQADLPAQPYDVVCSLAGKPTASQVVLLMTFTRAVSFAGNFSGSYGTVGTNATATATYTVNKNGSSTGTVAISTGGTFTFTTTSGATVSFAAGDRLTVTAPSSADATLADVAITFAGTR